MCECILAHICLKKLAKLKNERIFSPMFDGLRLRLANTLRNVAPLKVLLNVVLVLISRAHTEYADVLPVPHQSSFLALPLKRSCFVIFHV